MRFRTLSATAAMATVMLAAGVAEAGAVGGDSLQVKPIIDGIFGSIFYVGLAVIGLALIVGGAQVLRGAYHNVKEIIFGVVIGGAMIVLGASVNTIFPAAASGGSLADVVAVQPVETP